MKAFFVLLLCLGLSAPIFGQVPAETATVTRRSPEELERLLSPIALYPDALIAVILPAATAPSDLVLAARYVAANGQSSLIDSQPWDDSVKALTHYPALLAWMDQNLEWTRDIGEAFAVQPTDVMTVVQQLREKARASGVLADTPQQRVVEDQGAVYIVPAQENVIYIPSYSPDIFWESRPYDGPFITFGVGFALGGWLHYDCDWRRRSVWVHHRGSEGWAYHPDWQHREYRERLHTEGHTWTPDPRRTYSIRHYGSRPVAVVNTPVWSRDRDHGPRDGRPENEHWVQGVRTNPPMTGTVAPVRPDDHGHHVARPDEVHSTPIPAYQNNGRISAPPPAQNFAPPANGNERENRRTWQENRPAATVVAPGTTPMPRGQVPYTQAVPQGAPSSVQPGAAHPGEVHHSVPPSPPAAQRTVPNPPRNDQRTDGGDHRNANDHRQANRQWR